MFLVFYFSYINLDVIIPSKIKIQILCQILYFISFFIIIIIILFFLMSCISHTKWSHEAKLDKRIPVFGDFISLSSFIYSTITRYRS